MQKELNSYVTSGLRYKGYNRHKPNTNKSPSEAHILSLSGEKNGQNYIAIIKSLHEKLFSIQNYLDFIVKNKQKSEEELKSRIKSLEKEVAKERKEKESSKAEIQKLKSRNKDLENKKESTSKSGSDEVTQLKNKISELEETIKSMRVKHEQEKEGEDELRRELWNQIRSLEKDLDYEVANKNKILADFEALKNEITKKKEKFQALKSDKDETDNT